MNNFKKFNLLVQMLLAAMVVLATPLRAETTPAVVEVIANPQVKTESLETGTLRAIFSMRMRTWPDGQPIRVFVLPDTHRTHSLFCKKVLRVYPFVLRDQWDRLTFTGTGRPPEIVASEEELLELIRTTPGAIGYSTRRSSDTVKSILITEFFYYASDTSASLADTGGE